MALHVHYKTLYISQAEYIQPFAKFVREMQVQFLIEVFLDVD